jgi:hypothetical protein
MKLCQWSDLAGEFKDGIILGNGASIAVDGHFSYKSLYKEATGSFSLDSGVTTIFESYKTHDFELVLGGLSTAHQVNVALGVHDVEVVGAYNRVRDVLIKTIHQIHVSYPKAKQHLPAIAQFLKPFKRVFSLNYDLLVYWAMMHENNKVAASWFKDCFANPNRTFKEDFEPLARPFGKAKGATLVFYPHGNLILGIRRNSQISKIVSGHADLLKTITKQWTLENCTPLFVSEGSSAQKKKAIHRHSYLQFVLNNVLAQTKMGGNFVCFGWSMSRWDKHLLDALGKNKPSRLAISVYTGAADWESHWKEVRDNLSKTDGYRDTEFTFFDSESENCWIH